MCVPVDKPLPSNSRSSAAIATGCRAVGGRGAGGARWKMLCVGRGSPGPPPAPAAAAPGGVLVSLARGRGDGVGADPAAQLPNWPRGALRGQALGARSSSDLGLKAWICSGSAPSNPVAEPAGGAGFPGGSNFTRGARCEVFSGESRSLPALVAR